MRKILAICAIFLAFPAIAQDEKPGLFDRLFGSDDTTEDQGSFLERLIEDNLSGDDRQVSITGFSGALSGRATMDSLTISDAEGDWFTMSDAVLDWNRSALLAGRLEVAEISAALISLPRLPTPLENDTPTPEASGFSLPELPVSIQIEKIAAARVEIGQPVIGADAVVSVAGSISLADGEGSADLDIQKLDAEGGLTLKASYSNASEVLAFALDVNEGPDGIIANLADLPGRPALDFRIQGDAPLSDFAADIALSTDGQERLSGTISTDRTDEETLRTIVDISGDLAPVFAPAYQPFFGPDIALRAAISSRVDGSITLEDLTLRAAALTLDGTAVIAGGVPQEIQLRGRIADDSGAPVLLPIGGPETRVDTVDLTVSFDSAKGEDWQGSFNIEGLSRDGFSAENLKLDGTGRISPGTITANFTFAAEQLDLGSENAKEALGETVSGAAQVRWSEGEPISVTDLAIEGESYGLTGRADIALREDGPEIEGTAQVRADNLSVFAGLAQRKLGGRAELEATFTTSPLAGTFDISAKGQTTDLRVDQPEADRILEGEARLELTTSRDENGLRVNISTLESPNAKFAGQVTLKSGGSTLSLEGSLVDAALLLPQVSGPLRVTANAEEDSGRIWGWQAQVAMDGTRLSATGNARDVFTLPIIAADGRIEADALSDFAALANRPLEGALTADFAGEVVADLSRASLNLTGQSTDLKIGQQQADELLEGRVAFDISGAMAGDSFVLQEGKIDGPQVLLQADGAWLSEESHFAVNGRLADAARLLVGAPPGALSFDASGKQDGRDWLLEAKAEGPQLALNVEGVALDLLGTPGFDGKITADADDLSIFSTLAGRPLKGRIALTAEGGALADVSDFDVQANFEGQDVSVGIAALDQLLAGKLVGNVAATRSGNEIDIRSASISTDLLTASANGALGKSASAINLQARLANIAAYVDGISGPLDLTGTIGQDGENYTVDINATGPGGAQATAVGTTAPDFGRVDITLNGNAPLGLANRFISPSAVSGQARFNLSINGAPEVGNLTGSVSSSGARFIAPGANVILQNIETTTQLSGGRAQISLTANVEGGGRVSVQGPLTLNAPYAADLNITLNEVRLTNPKLFETEISGRLSVTGPLTGNARIAGNLELGETNIRIPSSNIGGTGEVPEIIHLNEPPPVRGTRRRAGLLDREDGRGSSGPGFPLDITVNAPNRIFVRGRGLESEFGGTLRITGTTSTVIPVGAFNLVRGRLDILGQRLALDEAIVTLQGSFEPILRIRATTQSGEYTINVLVGGRAGSPDITFTAEPDLPQEEVLARLIFGRGLETLSPLQAARLALAVRTLAGQGGEGVVGNIRDSAGLADLDVTTDEEGNTAVRAGAYLGENIYTDVEVDSGGETNLNLNLDVSPSVTLKGSVNSEGDTSLGVFFERDY